MHLYAISAGVSPVDIQRYDISTGPVTASEDSAYHGDYPMCGDIWISRDGLRILTGCGTAFRASPGSDDDMTYNGALEDVPSGDSYPYRTDYRSIAHDAVNGKVYAIPRDGRSYDETPEEVEATFRTFSYEFLTLESTRSIPCHEANTTAYTMYGRFVFASADGEHIYVIAQAANSALLNDWGLGVFDVE
jgi:hypothetical protein